jgi:hypothetical protein
MPRRKTPVSKSKRWIRKKPTSKLWNHYRRQVRKLRSLVRNNGKAERYSGLNYGA